MYGVPDTTNSRVPGTLPGRPAAGNRFRLSTALVIATTVLAEASGLSWAMYSDTAIRFARAAPSQLTRTSRQTPDRPLHFFFADKVTCIGLGYTFLDFIDLPFIHADKFLDRLGGDERTAAVHRFRQTIELVLEFCIQAESENRGFRHGVYIIQQLYTVCVVAGLCPAGTGHSPVPTLYAAPKRTDTSFDTPGSCIVTP